MALNRTYKNTIATTILAVLLCSGSALAQSENPWNPYPRQQRQPAQPVQAPTPKPTYYQENPAPNQTAPLSPSRFAPADLAQRLSAPPNRPQATTPYGYPPQGYPINAPQNYGGNGPPIIGNTGWGTAPSNNFFPFGF